MNWYGMTNEEREAAVEPLLAQHWSKAKIADALGANSRNVIIGWVYRHMPDIYRPSKEAKAQQNRLSARQAGKARRARKPKSAILQRPTPKQPPARPVAIPLPTEGLIRFRDMKPRGQCKFIWSDNTRDPGLMACGRPTEGEGSWCPAHRRLCCALLR